MARGDELVVLRGKLDQDYHKWLRSHGLGSDHVVEYNAQSRDMSLSELIINDPEPVKKIIKQIGIKTVYVPWFSGRMEAKAEPVNVLGADLFGATETATIKIMNLLMIRKWGWGWSFKKIHFWVLPAESAFEHRNHDEKFYNMMDVLMPDWKRRKKILDLEVVKNL